jgi:hypothetical protein
MGAACSTHGKQMNTEFEGKRPIGIYSLRSNDNIKLDVKEIGWEFLDWIFFGLRIRKNDRLL